MSEAGSTAAGGPLPSAMWLWRSSPAEAVEVVRFVAEQARVRTGRAPLQLADRLRAAVECMASGTLVR